MAASDMGKEKEPQRIGIYDSSHGILSLDHILSAVSHYGASQLKATLRNIWSDKLFIGFLGLSVTGFGYLGVREIIKLTNYNARLKLEQTARNKALARFREMERQKEIDQANESTSGTTSPSSSTAQTSTEPADAGNGRKKRPTSGRKISLWAKLKRLLSIAIPNNTCYTAQILLVQFCLLVTRTFLSINCVKASIQAITHAIGGASWKWWVRWLWSFTLWMVGGIIVNSGLRFGESLLAIQIRSALTQHIHKNYFTGINFYKVNSQSSPSSAAAAATDASPAAAAATSPTATTPTSSTNPVEAPSTTVSPITQAMRVTGIENRIVRDVANFSDNVAFLYGHSFKPILEFILSLAEASTDLGFKRPIALFSCTVLINLAMRKLQPHLGRMIAAESENEGQLQQAHTRIASHVEEIAFMQGGATEEILIQDKLQALLFTKIKHNISRINKSVTDNFIKFSSMLIGGVFCHIPYILIPDLTPSQRMGSFRGTEEVMLRCGGAFTEILLLGKELQEVGGHCDRILDVMDALEHCNQSSPDAAMNSAGNQDDILVCTSEGCSVRRKGDLAHGKTSSTQNLRRSVSGMLIDDSLDQIIMKKVTVVPPEDHPAYTSWFVSQQEQLKADKTAIIEPFNGRLLIADLNLNIPQGKSVLITGPNGCGKTSLFRCLAGLWPIGSGYLYRPSGGIMMVPQNPYLIYGTLRDNVTYPVLYRLEDKNTKKGGDKQGFENKNQFFEKDNDTTSITIHNNHVVYVSEEELDAIDDNVYNAMVLANGGNVIKNQPEGLYTIGAWDTKLSGGERQKVGFARVFFHKPAFALLDESTSAVAPDAEAVMYRNVTNAGITVFSIAHRPALRAYHQIELIYAGDGKGGYEIKDLTK
jgi:ABC-type uncharacterized transport system fused permease/ATPase subunit